MASYTSPFLGFTGLANELLQANPGTAYQLWQGAFGATPQRSPRMYSYTSGLQDWFTNDYYARGAKNPGLSWTSYLDDLAKSGGGLDSIWSGLAPSQRGESNSQFAPPVKWLNRAIGGV